MIVMLMFVVQYTLVVVIIIMCMRMHAGCVQRAYQSADQHDTDYQRHGLNHADPACLLMDIGYDIARCNIDKETGSNSKYGTNREMLI